MSSVYDMAVLITRQCLGGFNRQPDPAGKSLLDIFRISVNEVVGFLGCAVL